MDTLSGEYSGLSGIYLIVNLKTLKCYVGSTRDLQQRSVVHRSDLRKGCHHSRHLQRSWDLHGEDSFVFIPVCECPDRVRTFIEQYFMDVFQPDYNCMPARPTHAFKVCRSDEHRREASERMKGLWKDPEYREAMSEKRKEQAKKREFKETVSKIVKSRWADPAFREKMMAQRSTPEWRAKMSAASKRAKEVRQSTS